MSGGAAMGLIFEVELADAPSEAEGDEAGYGVARLGGGDGGGIDGRNVVVAIEKVADADAEREAAIEEGGRNTEVDSDVAFLGGVEAEGRRAVVDVGVEVDQLGHLGPEASIECPRKAFLPGLAFNVIALQEEASVEAHACPCDRAVGEVGVGARFVGGGDIERHGVGDDAPQKGVGRRGGSGDALDAACGAIGIGIDADVADFLEVAVPRERGLVGGGVSKVAVADRVGVVAIDAAAREVAARGSRVRVGVVEAEIVHRRGAMGEREGGFESDEAEEGIVREKAAVVNVEPIVRSV